MVVELAGSSAEEAGITERPGLLFQGQPTPGQTGLTHHMGHQVGGPS